MTNEKIHFLIERFLDAETTLEEERELYAFFAQKDIPEEFEDYREMFVGYAEMAKESEEQKPKVVKFRWMKSLSIAASVALFVAVGSLVMNNLDGGDMYVRYENGHTVTDETVVMASMESTMNGMFADYDEIDVEQQMSDILK